MSLRAIVIGMILVVGIVAAITWKRQLIPAQGAPAPAEVPIQPMPSATPPTIEAANDPGMTWVTPARWSTAAERPMRFATYTVPAAAGDVEPAEPGECAVFHFGLGQGGAVDANLDRWVSQFEKPLGIVRSASEVAGLRISRVKVRGDYLAPSGPMMEAGSLKQDWMLLGAIVEGRNGSVFFKFAGPRATVLASQSEFDAMLASLQAK